MSAPLPILTIVTRFTQLKQLTDRATRLGELNCTLLACLPAALAPHVQLATVRDGCLVLHAEGSTWAAQLRFKAPQILEKLRALPDFSSVQSVRVRNVAKGNQSRVPVRRALMSQVGADALRLQATCTDDDRLRAALERLAQHGRAS